MQSPARMWKEHFRIWFPIALATVLSWWSPEASAAPPAERTTPSLSPELSSTRAVLGVEPADLVQDAGVELTLVLKGRNLENAARVFVGPHGIAQTRRLPDGNLAVSLPSSLLPGIYTVEIEWADGTVLCSPQPLVVRERPCELGDIPFRQGHDDLDGENADPLATARLESVLACLARSEGKKLQILGFASREGDEAFNLTLSKRRAAKVAARISARLPGTTVETVGFGEVYPKQVGATEQELAASRRVVVLESGTSPCQGSRLSLESDGGLKADSSAVLQAQAACFASRGVSAALVVLPDNQDVDSGDRARKLLETVRTALATSAPAKSAKLHPLLARPGDRGAIEKVLGVSPEPDAAGDRVLLYPLTWLIPARALVSHESPHAACQSSLLDTVPEPVASLTPLPVPDRPGTPPAAKKSFLQVRMGALRAFDDTLLGGSIRAGRGVLPIGRSADLYVGADLSMFFADHNYKLTGDLTANSVIFLSAAGGISKRISDFRLDASVSGGLLMPAAAAFVAGGEGTVAWRFADSLELLGSLGGGVCVWGEGPPDGHWASSLGIGWWLP